MRIITIIHAFVLSLMSVRVSIESLIPGMHPNATRRNVLVLLWYLLFFVVVTAR